MGEIEIAGRNALEAVQRISSNDASKLAVGQAQYSGLLTPAGTFIDDLLVYRLAASHFLLVVNAGNIPKDYAWIAEQIKPAGDAVAVDASSRYALLAIQGPEAQNILQPLTGVELGTIKYYWFAHGEVANVRATISRTGYTGEDGFEIFVPPQSADRVWLALLESGKAVDVIPCGLGARDTLRLEAGMVEPTESEAKDELDRFCEAMIAIRGEIQAVIDGKADPKDNVLKNAPHTAGAIAGEWTHPYTRDQAAFPLPFVRASKHWPSVGRIDNPFGDRNLMCACPPVAEYV